MKDYKTLLLDETDIVLGSRTKDYKGQIVIYNAEGLSDEYKNSLNQLWVCTHGPATKFNVGHSDTIHLTHITDKDRLAVSRSEILGIAKSEVVVAVVEQFDVLDKFSDLQKDDEEFFR